MRSLQARVVVVGVVGAVVVAVVTAIVALSFVRSVARDEARDQLARATETLAARPQATRRLLRVEQSVAGPDTRSFRAVRTGQTVPPAVADVLDEDDLTAVRGGRDLSETRAVDGRDVIVEARRSRGGVVVVGLQPVAGLDAIDAALVRRLLLALVVGVVVSSAVAVVVARRVVRPVRETAATAGRLAAGERGVQGPRTTVTEVAEVGAALTALDAALTQSEARQREFLLSVSHEIRTPLTALEGYAEALRDGAVDASDVGDVGAVLVDQAGRLERFVADLLALARLEADDFPITRESVDVGAVARDASASWRGVASRAEIDLSVVGAEAPRAWTDPRRLRQLLDGLLENALRATPPGGHVVLRVGAATGRTTMTVTDDGPGLDPSDLERAFDRGYLRDRHAADRSVGTGLGLSIAGALARRLDIDLTATPRDDGRGLAMRLSLPAADQS